MTFVVSSGAREAVGEAVVGNVDSAGKEAGLLQGHPQLCRPHGQVLQRIRVPLRGRRCQLHGTSTMTSTQHYLTIHAPWSTSNIAEFIPWSHCDLTVFKHNSCYIPHQNVFNIYWKGVYYTYGIRYRQRCWDVGLYLLDQSLLANSKLSLLSFNTQHTHSLLFSMFNSADTFPRNQNAPPNFLQSTTAA